MALAISINITNARGTPFVTATTLIIDAKAGMSSSDPGAPTFQVREFICPFCGVYAQQNWSTCRLPHGTIMGGGSRDDYPQTSHAQCVRCKKYSVWHKEKMIYPSEGIAPSPHPDLPVDDDNHHDHIKDDYIEAGAIVSHSSRGAAALLRLVVEKLVDRIIEDKKLVVEKNQNSLYGKIGVLVGNGLTKQTQQGLDIVRVIGNNAVHPGQIDLKDDLKTALTLFRLVNMIVEDMITKPRSLELYYQGLPDQDKNGIDNRDRANNKNK